jgi:hypothetical protein
LEFKNIILEENFSKKYKNGNENFSVERVPWFWDFLLGYAKTISYIDPIRY